MIRKDADKVAEELLKVGKRMDKNIDTYGYNHPYVGISDADPVSLTDALLEMEKFYTETVKKETRR